MLSPREKEAKEYLRSEVSLMEDSMVGMGVEENIAAASAPLNMDSANNKMPGCDLLFDLIQEGESSWWVMIWCNDAMIYEIW